MPLKVGNPGCPCCGGCTLQAIPITAAAGWQADSGWTLAGGSATCAAGQTNQALVLRSGPNGAFGSSGSIRLTVPVINNQVVRVVWQYVDHANYRFVEWYSVRTAITPPPYAQRVIRTRIGEVVDGAETILNEYNGQVDFPYQSLTIADLIWTPTAASLSVGYYGFNFGWPSFSASYVAGAIGVLAVDTADDALPVTAGYDYCVGLPNGCGYCVDGWGPYQYQVVLAGAVSIWGLPDFSGTWVCTATYFVDASLDAVCIWRCVSGDRTVDVRMYSGGVDKFNRAVMCYRTGTHAYVDTTLTYGWAYGNINHAPPWSCLGADHYDFPRFIGPLDSTCTVTALP